jgi:short-subunit dehydrogenase
VTGASSGIGEVLARQLIAQGARLLVVARRAERLTELARSLRDARGQIEVFAGDVTDATVRAAALDRAAQAFGGLDLLVNNAGSGAMGRFDEATPERLRQVMEVDFFAPAEMIRLAVPLLRQGRAPLIVNMGSVLGHRGVPFCAEYCASKFALRGLSESLRAELAPLGIDLLLVSPARTQTEFFASALDGDKSRWPGLQGIPSDTVARQTVAAMRAGRHEIVPSASGKLLVWLSRLAPRVLDRVLARQARP